MIKASEKRVIVSVLGKYYANSILEELNRRNILNQRGKPFLRQSIVKIVNGNENLPVESVIAKFVAKKKTEKIAISKKNSALIRK